MFRMSFSLQKRMSRNHICNCSLYTTEWIFVIHFRKCLWELKYFRTVIMVLNIHSDHQFTHIKTVCCRDMWIIVKWSDHFCLKYATWNLWDSGAWTHKPFVKWIPLPNSLVQQIHGGGGGGGGGGLRGILYIFATFKQGRTEICIDITYKIWYCDFSMIKKHVGA